MKGFCAQQESGLRFIIESFNFYTAEALHIFFIKLKGDLRPCINNDEGMQCPNVLILTTLVVPQRVRSSSCIQHHISLRLIWGARFIFIRSLRILNILIPGYSMTLVSHLTFSFIKWAIKHPTWTSNCSNLFYGPQFDSLIRLQNSETVQNSGSDFLEPFLLYRILYASMYYLA